jgi:hypothetical protein
MLIFTTLLATLSSILRSRAALEFENLAQRHQIGVEAVGGAIARVNLLVHTGRVLHGPVLLKIGAKSSPHHLKRDQLPRDLEFVCDGVDSLSRSFSKMKLGYYALPVDEARNTKCPACARGEEDPSYVLDARKGKRRTSIYVPDELAPALISAVKNGAAPSTAHQ